MVDVKCRFLSGLRELTEFAAIPGAENDGIP
jgi:hypothetical protein